jgi:hypothetical protein
MASHKSIGKRITDLVLHLRRSRASMIASHVMENPMLRPSDEEIEALAAAVLDVRGKPTPQVHRLASDIQCQRIRAKQDEIVRLAEAVLGREKP